MNEYLPPVVTQLKADLSDLVAGVAEARALIKSFARGARDDLVEGMRGAAIDAGKMFTVNLKGAVISGSEDFSKSFSDKLTNEAEKTFGKAGSAGGSSLMASLKSAMWPALIGLLVLLTPMISTVISSAIALGFSLGFIGLGAFLLRDQKGLIDAATKLKETLSSTFKDAAAPMLGPLIQALNILNSLVISIGPSFKQIFAALAPAIVPLTEGLAGLVRNAMPGFIEFMKVAAGLTIDMAGGLPKVGTAISDMFRSFAENGPAMKTAIIETGKAIAGTLIFLGQFFKVMGDIYLGMIALRDLARSQGWDTPWNAIKTGAKAAWEFVLMVSGAVAGWAVGIWNSTTGWISKTWKAISDWGAKVATWAGTIPEKIATHFRELPGKIGAAASAAFDAFFFAVGFGITRAGQVIAGFPPMVLGYFAQLKNDLVAWTARTILEALAWWAHFKLMLPVYLSEAWNATVAWAVNTRDSVIMWISRTVIEVGEWLGKIPGFVLLKGQEAKERILNFFKDSGSWLVGAGKGLLEGLIQGVSNSIDWAVGMIKRAMDKIKQGAKDALGISSPSRAFAQLGTFSMQGYILGLQSGQSGLQSVWRGLTPPVGSAATGGLNGLAMRAAGGGAGGLGAGTAGGTQMVEVTVNVDGEAIVRAITPAAQRRKDRTGTTGLA